MAKNGCNISPDDNNNMISNPLTNEGAALPISP